MNDNHYRQLDDAAMFLGDYCRKWGRFGGQTKEKYGTVRFYAHLGNGFSLHELIYPGYVYSRFPHWLWVLDCNLKDLTPNWINDRILAYRIFIYRRAYRLCVQKYPGVAHCHAADYPELLTDILPLQK